MKNKSNRNETLYKLMKPFVISNFKRKYKPIVNGSENIPTTGPIIFCGNHRHKDDQYNVMLATKRVIHMISKDEYFKGNKAWFYRAACCIPVNRDIHDIEAKNEAIDILNIGGAVGLFPEGTRNEVTCKNKELVKISKLIKMDIDEVNKKLTNKCIRTTQVELLFDLHDKKKITFEELKDYIFDADNAMKKLLNKKVISKKVYEESLLLPLKFGAVSFAKKTNALIIPFGTVGAYDGNESVITNIGKPIDVSNIDIEEANLLLRKTIIDLMK